MRALFDRLFIFIEELITQITLFDLIIYLNETLLRLMFGLYVASQMIPVTFRTVMLSFQYRPGDFDMFAMLIVSTFILAGSVFISFAKAIAIIEFFSNMEGPLKEMIKFVSAIMLFVVNMLMYYYVILTRMQLPWSSIPFRVWIIGMFIIIFAFTVPYRPQEDRRVQ
jgi:hypothetical protein